MIDLTEDVSPTVLAETAAKLDAEQKQLADQDAQKRVAEATKAYDARLVSSYWRSTTKHALCYAWFQFHIRCCVAGD